MTSRHLGAGLETDNNTVFQADYENVQKVIVTSYQAASGITIVQRPTASTRSSDLCHETATGTIFIAVASF